MSVMAKVRPGNNYGGHAPEGTLIEVADAEVERVPWCLERVGDPLSWATASADEVPAPADPSPTAPKPKKQK